MRDFNNITSLNKKLGGSQKFTCYMTNFIDMLNKANVFSLDVVGVPFTWTNYHKDDTVIYERLYRVCINVVIFNNYPNIVLENFPIVGSDHGPICLTLKHNSERKRKSFRFVAMWLSHASFKPFVSGIWSQVWILTLCSISLVTRLEPDIRMIWKCFQENKKAKWTELGFLKPINGLSSCFDYAGKGLSLVSY